MKLNIFPPKYVLKWNTTKKMAQGQIEFDCSTPNGFLVWDTLCYHKIHINRQDHSGDWVLFSLYSTDVQVCAHTSSCKRCGKLLKFTIAPALPAVILILVGRDFVPCHFCFITSYLYFSRFSGNEF